MRLHTHCWPGAYGEPRAMNIGNAGAGPGMPVVDSWIRTNAKHRGHREAAALTSGRKGMWLKVELSGNI